MFNGYGLKVFGPQQWAASHEARWCGSISHDRSQQRGLLNRGLGNYNFFWGHMTRQTGDRDFVDEPGWQLWFDCKNKTHVFQNYITNTCTANTYKELTIRLRRKAFITDLQKRLIGKVTTMLLCIIKLMKGKTHRKHSRHEKIAASVLLKLFNSGNERWYTTDAPLPCAKRRQSKLTNKQY